MGGADSFASIAGEHAPISLGYRYVQGYIPGLPNERVDLLKRISQSEQSGTATLPAWVQQERETAVIKSSAYAQARSSGVERH